MSLAFLRRPDAFFGTSRRSRLGDEDEQHVASLAQSHEFQLPAGTKGVPTTESYVQSSLKEMKIPFAPSEFQHPMHPGIKMAHGTTTMGFLFREGVLLAVDSRASMGSYIGSRTVKKVLVISRYLLGTMAGGAADCSFWERHLAFRARVYELREGRRITVAAASKLLANTVYQYRGYGLSMGTMIAGWDETTGPALYYVDNDGTRLKGDRFSVGSGSTYAYGILDTEYRFDLDVQQAVELGKRCIYHATHRDAYSGGTINVFVITADGWKQYFSGDCNDLHWGQYREEKLRRDNAARDVSME